MSNMDQQRNEREKAIGMEKMNSSGGLPNMNNSQQKDSKKQNGVSRRQSYGHQSHNLGSHFVTFQGTNTDHRPSTKAKSTAVIHPKYLESMETAIVCEDCNEVLTVAAKIEEKIKCSSFIAFIASFANDVDDDSLHSIPNEPTPNRDTVGDHLLSEIDENGDRMLDATGLFKKRSRFNT